MSLSLPSEMFILEHTGKEQQATISYGLYAGYMQIFHGMCKVSVSLHINCKLACVLTISSKLEEINKDWTAHPEIRAAYIIVCVPVICLTSSPCFSFLALMPLRSDIRSNISDSELYFPPSLIKTSQQLSQSCCPQLMFAHKSSWCLLIVLN